MRLGWAILAGLLLGVGVYWFFGRQPAPLKHAGKDDVGQAQVAQGPPLYRWRDDAGTLQITDAPPPKGRHFERIAVDLSTTSEVKAAR